MFVLAPAAVHRVGPLYLALGVPQEPLALIAPQLEVRALVWVLRQRLQRTSLWFDMVVLLLSQVPCEHNFLPRSLCTVERM